MPGQSEQGGGSSGGTQTQTGPQQIMQQFDQIERGMKQWTSSDISQYVARLETALQRAKDVQHQVSGT